MPALSVKTYSHRCGLPTALQLAREGRGEAYGGAGCAEGADGLHVG